MSRFALSFYDDSALRAFWQRSEADVRTAFGDVHDITRVGMVRNYGLTYTGGESGQGVVFELTPNSDGSWTEEILHSFNGSDGAGPHGVLSFDAAGNLYGSTLVGGQYGVGVIFQLSPDTNGEWKDRTPCDRDIYADFVAGEIFSNTSFGHSLGCARPYESIIRDPDLTAIRS